MSGSSMFSGTRHRYGLLRSTHYKPNALVFALVGATAALISSSIAHAQTPPDAGALQRQIEQEQRQALPAKAAPQFALPAPMQSLGGATVTVKEFRLAGNTLLSNAKLLPAVAEYLNKPLDFAALQNAARTIATTYRNAGWVVRVYLPEQDITTGIVTIQVIEAKFGDVRVEGQPERISAERLRRMVKGAQAADTPVNAGSLDRALLLIDDLPGISATGRLSEGQSATETDLVLSVADSPLVTSNIYADNAGARYTGAARIIANSSFNSPFRLGDRIDALLLHSSGSDYVRAGYSLPLFNHGLRMGANVSHLSYNIGTPEFLALDAHGTSSDVGLEASYPLLRARLKNIYFSLTADDKRFENKSAGIIATKYGVQTVSANFSGNLFDSLGGGGANSASLTYVQGRVDLNGSPNATVDALTTNTAGSFHKMLLTAARQQAITERVSIYASGSMQTASKNLDSSEKFYLGGSTGVRAYPSNEGGGSEGWMANLEGRVRLPAKFNFTGFFDWGSVKVNKDNDIIGAATPNTIALKGAGVSVDWRANFGLTLKATVAHRLGDNPNPTLTGKDQDGSLVKTRVWLQASLPF